MTRTDEGVTVSKLPVADPRTGGFSTAVTVVAAFKSPVFVANCKDMPFKPWIMGIVPFAVPDDWMEVANCRGVERDDVATVLLA